jgi:hypothetical protein
MKNYQNNIFILKTGNIKILNFSIFLGNCYFAGVEPEKVVYLRIELSYSELSIHGTLTGPFG